MTVPIVCKSVSHDSAKKDVHDRADDVSHHFASLWMAARADRIARFTATGF